MFNIQFLKKRIKLLLKLFDSDKGIISSKTSKKKNRIEKRRKEIICEISQKMHWRKKYTKEQIESSRSRLGVTYTEYLRFKLYLLNDEEQSEKLVNIKRARLQKELRAEVKTATGWDYATIRNSMANAREKYGITNRQYVKHKFYAMTEEECLKKGSELKEMQLRREARKEACIEAAMEEMNWSRDEAINKIEDARKRLGISYRDYRLLRMARIAPQDQEQLYQRILTKRIQRKAEHARQEAEIEMRSGWSHDEMQSRFEEARRRTGCRWAEFYQFHFDELTNAEQESIFLQRHHAAIRKRYPYADTFLKIVENKEKTNLYFNKYISRPWCSTKNLTFQNFEALFSNSEGIVYKPIFGLQAQGVEAFYFSDLKKSHVWERVSAYPQGVLEEIVIQHPKLSALNPSSVNTVRIVTVSSTTRPVTSEGAFVAIAGATLKIGGSGSIVDNLHAGGGVCSAVDLNTGILITDGADWNGNRHALHPVTNLPIKGFQVPYFTEAKQFVLSMINDLKIDGVLGWDIAIGVDGPVLIEPNTKPDPTLLSIPYAAEHKGILDQMKRFLF